MSNRAYIGIDLGTTSVKCLAVDDGGRVRAAVSEAYASYTPHPGWVEQEPEEWMQAVYKALAACLEALAGYRIQSVSFSGHMSSPVFLDERFQPLARCITISDIRSVAQTERLMGAFRADFETTCGNRPLDCFGASKLLWFKEGRAESYRKTRRFVFAKDYVRGRLTSVYNTDPTDAGNSLLYDFSANCWNEALIRAVGLEPALFPDVMASTAVAGFSTEEAFQRSGLPLGTPVVCGGADMACSQLGTGALRDGLMVVTLSTTGQICMHVPGVSSAGVGKLTFHQGAPRNSLYAMASVFSGGLSVNWTYQTLHDKKAMEKSDYGRLAELSEDIGRVPPGAEGVSFLPFLTGSGSPYFDTDDRAAFIGLSCGVSKAQMLRAAMEGVAYNIRENVGVFESMGTPVRQVRLGGGGTKMQVWSGVIADVLGRDLPILDSVDASAIGACILARTIDRGENALIDMSDEMVACGQTIRHNEQNSRLYGRLFEQYEQLYDMMHRWQKTQRAILSGKG